jgi:hypothetical protein
MYNSDQTGAKIQLGGLKTGFTNVGYHVVILSRVTIPDKYPIVTHVATTKTILKIFCILLYLISFKYTKQTAHYFYKKSIFAQINIL